MTENESAKLLLERWQRGEEAAAEGIYRRYSQRLCALAEQNIGERLRRRVDSDDVVQSVFRTFFRRSHDGEFVIDHSGSLWSLLVKITLNKIRGLAEHHRAKRRDLSAEVQLSGEQVPPELIAREPTPAEAAALNDEIEAALAGLRADEVEMFRLCLQGCTTPEIAGELGCSRWTVRRVLDRLGHRLEKRLEGGNDT